jgi:dTDP-4-amino-4,6-dideoxygalactose transaminase
VVTTAFSFFATASAILRCGARPVLADIDPLTFNLSPSAVEALLTGTRGNVLRAILPVHLYGQCADWDAFSAIKRRFGVKLIEDAAQAFGADWRGLPAGALGDSAAFSFYPTKNLAAMGEAGLVTTTSAEIDDRVRSLRAHGMRRRYYHDEVGWNSRLDTIQAAVLQVKLRHLPAGNARRRELASRYDALFAEAELFGKGIVLPFVDPRGTHVFHQYVIRTPRRDALRAYLADRRIGSEVYYPVPLHLQAALKDLGYRKGAFPQSERAAEEVLALPIYPELREDEQDTVVEAIRQFFSVSA